MVSVATSVSISLPMLIYIPRFFSPGGSILGAGDIVLPGLFLCYLYRLDHALRTPWKQGYFFRAWIAYIIGLMFTILMLYVLQRGQPALLYLVPAIISPTVFWGWKKQQLSLLWYGIPHAPVISTREPVTTENELNEENASLITEEESQNSEPQTV